MNVLGVTTGLWDPASNFRVRALIPHLAKLGLRLKETIPLVSAYPPKTSYLRPTWFLAAVVTRLPILLESLNYDAILFQRELISTLATLERVFSRPKVFDVDDAIHLNQRGKSIERIAASCDMVICGNHFLAEVFSKWNRQVCVIPTGVDTERYRQYEYVETGEKSIGWIGTSSNFQYLYDIEAALAIVLRARPDVVLHIVSDRAPQFKHIPTDRIRFERWSYENDVTKINSFTVGVMPLSDDEWARGKCSFKLLQYYACCVSAVASPIGMNKDILERSVAGIPAVTKNDWVDALVGLLDSSSDRASRGAAGRQLVEAEFSLSVVADKLNRHISNLIKGSGVANQ